jgi:hypothetical protein
MQNGWRRLHQPFTTSMTESADTPRLTVAQCHEQAKQCESMARLAGKPAHRIMLEHMAATWMRIAAGLQGSADS